MFKRRNVELVTDRIAEVRERSVVTQDGIERPVDVLIYGTGFHVTDQFIGMKLFGRGGIEIHDAWRKRMSAYLGVTVSGFPNFFMLLGPNTGLGHSSMIYMQHFRDGSSRRIAAAFRRKSPRPHGAHRLAVRRMPQLVSGHAYG